MSTLKRLLRCLGAVTILLFIMHMGGEGVRIPIAHAQSNTADSMMTQMAMVMGVIITSMNFLTWVLFYALNIIMDPAFIFGTQPGGQDGSLLMMIHEIWQLSRDLVNVGFAIFLIVTAIYIAVRPAHLEEAKKALPKFVIAIVLVNFTWFIPRVLFDVSQILTYTVYQIPNMLSPNGCVIPPPDGVGPPRPCDIVTNVVFFEDTNDITDGEDGWDCPLRPLVCYQSVPATKPGNIGMQSQVLNGLVINYARLKTLATISDPRAANGGEPVSPRLMLSFIIRSAMVLLLHVALFFPILALVVAFLFRIPILLITMSFMPFVALAFVMEGSFIDLKKISGEFELKSLLMGHFISAVFLPAVVGVPFAVGFIILNVGSVAAAPPGFTAFATAIPLFAGVATIGQLFWMLNGLTIIWIGVFTALKTQKSSARIVEQIQGFGTNLGKLAWKAPLSLPILPAPGGGKMSANQAGKLANPKEWLGRINAGETLGPDTIGKILNRTPAGVLEKQGAAAQTIIPRVELNINNLAANPNSNGDFDAIMNAMRQNQELSRLSGGQIMEAIIHAMEQRLTPQQKAQLRQAAQQRQPQP
ncbi:hypothetical protein HY213_03330 [Candidatus Peregrinibacteria bacterium]|nr:hypothetical protein [Candidatus Peregrinibacteria bacterium]